MSNYHLKGHSLFWFLLGVLIVLFLTLLCEIADAEMDTYFDVTLYTIPTDQNLTVEWDDSNPTVDDYFEFHMWNIGEQKKYLIGKTQALTVTVKLPRTGLFTFFCRACDKPESDTTRECSDYAASHLVMEDGTPYAQVKDPVTGNLIPGKWMIYGHVAAPTGGGVVPTP